MAIGLAALVLGWFWLVGIYLGSLATVPSPLGLGGIVVAALLAVLHRRAPLVVLACLAAAATLGGALRYEAAVPRSPSALSLLNGSAADLRGGVVEEPTPRGRWVDLVVEVRERQQGEAWTALSGRTLVRTDGLVEYQVGDRVELGGRVEEPPEFDGFSYRDYLARSGISSILRYPTIRTVGRDEPDSPTRLLLEARRRARAILERFVPEPAGSLAVGILLGQRAGMSSDLLDAFARTNTTHIIAISGMNIALVIGLLQPLARLLPGRWLGLFLTWLVIAAYTVLVGGQPSVVRAAGMGGLAAWGRCLGRPADALVGLSLAGLAATFAKPLWLWDLGFQLSYLATAGIVLLVPLFEARLRFLPEWARSSLAVTTAAQVATLPLLTTATGQIGLISPVANLLAGPALAPATLTGLATIGLGAVWAWLAAPAAWLTWLNLRYLIGVVEVSAALPAASLPIGRLGEALAPVWLVVLLLVASLGPTSPLRGLGSSLAPARSGADGQLRARWLLPGLGLLTAVAWTGALASRPADTLLTFLDVGQGDAILIQTPSGRNVLVDGGPDPVAVTDALGRRLPFWSRRLDLVVLTHQHEDHLAGLCAVLERYEVARVLEPPRLSPSPAVDRWEYLLRDRGIPRAGAAAGQTIDLGDGARLEVLHPAEPLLQGTSDDENNNSVVLRLVANGQAVLLLGDAGAEGQLSILERGGTVAAQVVKAPHHGARDSLDERFLAAVAPGLAVVSVGRDNRFGHPAPETLALLRGLRLYRTDLNGSVEVELAPDGVRARPRRGSP